MPSRVLNIIGAPTSAGAYAPGQERAPAAFRRNGLIRALSESGCRPKDSGDIATFRWRPDLTQPKSMNLAAVAQACAAVSERVAAAIAAEEDVLVLGGDCTVELGTVAGANLAGAHVGLVYVDFDADLKTPETSDGALDWTGVAHLLNLPGCAEELAMFSPSCPLLAPEQILYFAVENITPAEAAIIEEHGIAVVSRQDVLTDINAATDRAVEWAKHYDCVLVHFDVDVLSFIDFPIAENVRRCDGLKLEQAAFALKRFAQLPQWRGLTITEVNPDHAPDEAVAFKHLNSVLGHVLCP